MGPFDVDLAYAVRALHERLDVDEPWRLDALCREPGYELSTFFLDGQRRAARAVCERCLVRAECLDFALAEGERFGMWGGLIPDARDRERRRRATEAA